MTNPLPDYQAALADALLAAVPIEDQETVPMADAGGRTLVAPVVADRDLPPFNRAQMDGYALRAGEMSAGRAWPVAATVPAGDPADVAVPEGSCVAIATGAPLPADVDTVVQHELSDRADPVHFTIDSIERGHAVHPRGADARPGDTLVATDTVLAPQHLGIAASVGLTELAVRRRPRAFVLTSGDEVVEPDAPVAAHQIRNSNRVMVVELLRNMGVTDVRAEHLPDERDTTVAAVGQALADADLVVTVGGVSAGDRDHFPTAFDAHDVEPTLHGAAIQPGKPVRVGRCGRSVVVALPGNPVSVLACACLFLWPITRVLRGLPPALPWRRLALAESVKPNPRRRAFRPAILQDDDRISIPRWAGSGDLCHTAPTSGLAELPVQSETVAEGTVVRFLGWP